MLVDDLLASLLTDLLRIVLTQLLVDRSTETDNRSGSRVADVHTNQHGVRQQFLGETEIEQIPTEFGVHLSQDVSSDRQVHLLAGPVSKALRDDIVLVAGVLDSLVLVLIGKHEHGDLGLT